MTTKNSLTLTVPQHWLPALFMGRTQQMTLPELRAYARWNIELHELGRVQSARVIGNEPFWAWDHEGTDHGAPGDLCLDVEITFFA